MTPPLQLRWDGPRGAATAVLLAHGAGAGMDHPFLAAVAAGLAVEGLAVARFEFPWQRRRRAGGTAMPDRLPVLQAALREAAALAAAPRLVLAGKSLGGRVAATLADELGAAALLVFGYPFHPPRRPDQLRTAPLLALRTPALLLQGERDPFGSRAEVAGYALSPAVRVQWFADGDHDLRPRRHSGATAAGHLAAAIAAAAAFARRPGPAA